MAENMPETAMLETIKNAAAARFPVAAKDLMPAFKGPALGQKLARLEQLWVNSGFTLTRADLLARRS
jgi:poly(A) polymerase/tRNA nucleotidyltransferase (CCA-adding enzyme)